MHRTNTCVNSFNNLSEPNKPPGIHKDFYRLSQQYGGIYTLYFGANKGVVLNSPELFYEALNVKQDETAQRPVLKSFTPLTFNHGVAMNNGKRWRAIRTVIQKSVTNKQLGEASEGMIMEEVNANLCALRKECEAGRGASFDLRIFLRKIGLNNIFRKLFNVRFNVEEPTQEYHEMQDWIRIIFEHIAQGSPSDFMPLFGLLPKSAEEKHYIETTKKMHKYLDEQLALHRQLKAKGTPVNDFMGIMIDVQEESKELQKSDPSMLVMKDLDITVSAWDMLAGAMDTSSTTVEWLILLLVNHPQVQEKLHATLDEAIGPNRLPTLADYPNIEYFTAVMCELFRFKHFAPQGLPHEAAEDITLGGYNVPKGTQIFLNFHSLHMNPRSWKDPEVFRPERFLEEDRDLLDTVLHSETYFKNPEAYKFVPYGQGRRRCVGYGLGRIVIWLEAVAMFHCFSWESPNGQPMDLDTEALGITLVPKLQNVRAVPRPAARLLRPESEITSCESH